MWAFLLLALIQGLVEWLPISSEGQSIIFLRGILGIDITAALSLTLWLHLGTLIAVLYYYRYDYFRILKGEGEEYILLRKFLVIATIMTGVIAIPLYIFLIDFFPLFLGDFITIIMGLFLIITGLVIYFSKKRYGERESLTLTTADMIIVGLIQGFAILPGLSRSGLTIAALLFLGFKNESALKLSFLMSAPAVIAGVVFDGIFSGLSFGTVIPFYILALALIITAVIGIITISALTKLSYKINFAYFCIILGVITILVISPFLGFSGFSEALSYISNGFYWIYDTLKNIILVIGPLGLFFVMIIQAILAPIPSEGVLILAGGAFTAFYGFPLGFIIAGVIGGFGEIAGAIISFGISKIGGRPIALKLIGEKNLEFADNWFEKYGGWAVLVGRLIPFIPFDAVSYGAGLTKIKTSVFLLATSVGAFPRAFIYAYFGYLLELSISYGGIEVFYIILTSIIALLIALILIVRYYLTNKREKDDIVVE
ncbi:MAG: undecaprenyl-diphosphate phosphatase [Candidatus Odinarchaeia archaeon]